MKAAFFHDVILFEDNNGNFYTDTSFQYSIWERYLCHFEQLTVVSRSKKLNEFNDQKLALSSGEHVSFKPITSLFNSPQLILSNQKKVRYTIKQALEETDCAIIRLPSIIGLFACHEALCMNKPFAIEVVGCVLDALWNYGSLKGKIAAPIMFMLNRFYIKKAKYVIYVSKKFLQKRYPSNGFQIDCSDVNINETPESVLLKRLEKIKDDSLKTIKFGLIGSLNVGFKGHETAIKALAAIKNKINDFELRCLGPGEPDRWNKLACELGIEQKVKFCGTLPSGEPILKWLDDIDIFLIPSLQEGLPRALVEAMSRGCPAIGTITGGIPELLDGTVLHKPKDYKELSRIILKLYNNKVFRAEQAERNFNEAKKYIKETLDSKRMGFWEKFKKDIGKN